jgi:hypothetical protein
VRHKPLGSGFQNGNQDPSGRANEAHVKADTEIAKVGVKFREKQGRSPFRERFLCENHCFVNNLTS